jgi:hypothetical protein
LPAKQKERKRFQTFFSQGKTFSIETSQYDMLRKPSDIDKGRLPSNHQASPMLEDLVKSVLLKSPLLSILFA